MTEEPFIITVLQDLSYISQLVNTFFKDTKKTNTWMNTKNPLLGGQEPVEMIFKGRTAKLKDFITNQLEGNNP